LATLWRFTARFSGFSDGPKRDLKNNDFSARLKIHKIDDEIDTAQITQ
jgi:hypothetical protein